ncbi:MAG: hypothetical protein HLUCCO16_07085 [Phormidium sp. OSCR]|nr:MAG: hypothetical protein HLUCCO16_07085 [Phormidium sp. OSCR]
MAAALARIGGFPRCILKVCVLIGGDRLDYLVHAP